MPLMWFTRAINRAKLVSETLFVSTQLNYLSLSLFLATTLRLFSSSFICCSFSACIGIGFDIDIRIIIIITINSISICICVLALVSLHLAA